MKGHLPLKVVLSSVIAVVVSAAWPAFSDRALWAGNANRSSGEMLVYVGTYTGAKSKSKGIYVFRLDLASGKATAPQLAAETANPSFLAIHPNRRFLYAVGELESFSGKPGGAVSAFALDAHSGKLTLLNQQPSGGAGPCHLVVDRTGKSVLVANYGGGSVAALPIGPGGRLGPPTNVVQHEGSSVNPQRQEGPHAHSINLDPANRFAAAADLGLDKVLVYRFDAANGKLVPNDPPAATVKAGAGPRHFAFHPGGRYAYVINEMDCTVTAFAYDGQRGVLKEIQTITTLPHELREGYSTAEVQVHPSGKFLYGSNRGHHSIVVYAIDPKTGKLTLVEHKST
ncbi:MAG: lactonase family protein, partial [Planctomycetes bacterium]|nr:lactonase family protein [Planctomycetota bacterium]